MPFAKGGKPAAKKGGRAKTAKKEKAPPIQSEESTVEVDTNIPLPASIEAISKAYMGLEMALALNHRLHTSPTLATLEATARRAQGASLTTEGLEALQCILPLTKGHLALFQLPKSKQKSGSQAEWTELFGVTPVDPNRKAKLGEGDLDSWHAAPALKGRLEEFKLNLSREWQVGGKPSNPSALAERLRPQMPTSSKTVISKIRRALEALKKHQSQESGSGDILDIDSLLDEDAMPIVEEEAAGEDPNKPGEGEDASGYFPPLTTMSVEDFVNERLLGPSGADRLCYCAKLPGREGSFVDLNQLGSITTERIRALLVERGIPSLYKHQATAIEAALRKEHVLVSTSTSSGKSLCYVIPILSQLEAFDTNTFAAGPSSSLGSYEGPPPPDSLPMTPDAGPACALDLLALAEEGGAPSASLGALPAQIQASSRVDSVGSSVIEVTCNRNAASITEIEESCPSVVLCDSQWQTQSQPVLQPPEPQAVAAQRAPIAPMEQAPPTASLLYSAGTDDDSCPRFIYLSPTKALGQDQLRSLKEFLPSHCHPWFATYDGDTTDIKDRYNVRRTARVLLTNPDMLHLNILPNHKQWAVWLRNLSYVVVDEAHSYRGVFGAHVAMVLRRLTRLCSMYKGIHIPSPDYPEGSEWGSDPTPTPLPLDACPFRFIVCSATLRNPAHHFLQLTGCRARLVHQDTSPSAARYIVTWNAPPIQSIQRAKAKALERLEASVKEEKKGKGKRGLKRGREGSPKSSPKLEREGEHNEVHPMEGVVEENPSPEEVDAERRRSLTDSEVHLDLWKYSDSMALAREMSEGASPSKQELQQQREREERLESRHMMLLEQKDMKDHLARRTKFGGLHPEERSSPYVEAGRVVAQLIMANIRTLVFVKVRQITELVLSYIKDSLMQHKCPHFASLVKCYRSGITPAERRQIERELFSGQLRGVVTTTALELGVDIGGLEAVVMVGYPGSCASLWQQMGRAGRGSAAGLAVMIGLGDPLNQFLLHNPRYLLCRPPEHTVVDPSNSHLLSSHLQCAAIEVPLSEEDETVGPALFGPSYPRIVKSILNSSALVARPAREMLRKKGWARFPAHSLRIAAARIQYPNLEDENTQGGFFLPDAPLEGVEGAGEDLGDDGIEGPDGKEKAEQKAEDKWLRRAVGEQEAVLVWEDTSEEAQARKRKKKRQAKSKPKAKPKAKAKGKRGRGRGRGKGSSVNDDQAPEDPLALLAAEEEGCRMQDEEPPASDSPKAGKGQEARGRQFHREVSLRSIAPEVFTVIREDTGDRLEDFHGFLAYMTVHEGAAYMCHGTTFLIVAFDHQSRTVTARPVNCSYHTRATDDTQVSHCHCEGAASIPLFPLDMLGGVKAEGPQQEDLRPPSLEVEVDMADMEPCVPSLDLITDTCGDSRMEEEDPQEFVDRKPGLPRWPTELTAKPCGCTASYQPAGPNASPSMGWMGPSMEGGEFIGDDQRLTRNPKARKRSRATNWEGWLGDPVPQPQSQPPAEDNNHLPTAVAAPPQTPTPEAGAAQQAPRPPGVSILPPDFSAAGSAPVLPEEDPAPKRQKIIVVSPKVATAPKVENKVRKVKPEAQGPATHEPDMGSPAAPPPPSDPRTPAKHPGEPSSDVSAGLAVLSEAYGGGSVVPSLEEPRLASVHRGLIKYQQRVKGFHKIHKRTEELLETVSLHYPLAEHSTHGVWIDVPHEVKLMCQRDDPGCDFFAGIHSILHTLLSLFPLHVNCDLWDVMGVSTDCHPTRNNCACITIFDVVPGGAGISTRAFEDVPRLLHQCYRQLEACPCVSGCVSCIFSSRCGCYNMGLDKITARNILLHMLFHTEGRKEEEGRPPAS